MISHALEVECQPIVVIYKEKKKIMYHWVIDKNTCIIYKMCNLFVPEFHTYNCQRKCDKSVIKKHAQVKCVTFSLECHPRL